MTTILAELSDDALNAETKRVAHVERRATAELLRLLIEVERRGLHLALGYSSMFAYCTRALRMSEQAAYSRITAARTARRHPRILDLLAEGALSLSSVGLLAPHLGDETADVLLDAAKLKSTREVERLIVAAFPQPDIPAQERALPQDRDDQSTTTVGVPVLTLTDATVARSVESVGVRIESALAHGAGQLVPSSSIAPIGPRRYLLKVTMSEATHAKLQQARALLRHAVPDGDVDEILGRALALLVDHSLRTKTGKAKQPRRDGNVQTTCRHIPAAIRRTVWRRDGGRCVFAGADGICGETSFLEFHHVDSFAAGGPTVATNLQLRCRAHNAYEARMAANNDGPGLFSRRAPG